MVVREEHEVRPVTAVRARGIGGRSGISGGSSGGAVGLLQGGAALLLRVPRVTRFAIPRGFPESGFAALQESAIVRMAAIL